MDWDWFDERCADAIWQARVDEGRCGNCGAFDGPDHRCPTINNTNRNTDK